MFQFAFIKAIVRKFGTGWTIGFTSGRDKYPTAVYNCPFCGQLVPHVAQHQGFGGVAPKAGCACKEPVPYPVNEEKFAVHLLAKPKWHDGELPPSHFIDTWA
jgi:hypothetical protein